MITGVFLADRLLPAPGADQPFDSVKVHFASGNWCIVEPSLRRNRAGKVYMVVNYAWGKQPSEADQAEVEAAVSDLFGPQKRLGTVRRETRGISLARRC